MKIIPVETSRILKNKKRLELRLKVKLTIKAKQVSITGKEEDIYVAEQILEAVNLGFPLQSALLLADENYVFEKISIKNLTKRKDLSRIRARIIGKHGATKKNLENLSNCFICVKDNIVGIIGSAEYIRAAMNALTNLIQGSRQASVFSFLEREKAKIKESDLGLKE